MTRRHGGESPEADPGGLSLEEMNDIVLRMGTEVRIVDGVEERIQHTRSLIRDEATQADYEFLEDLERIAKSTEENPLVRRWAPAFLRAMNGQDEEFNRAVAELESQRESE